MKGKKTIKKTTKKTAKRNPKPPTPAPLEMLPGFGAAAGIDISKASFDACYLRQSEQRAQWGKFANNASGFAKFMSWLNRIAGEEAVHFCLEETGVYSRALATFLYETGHHVSLVNPERPKRHGQSRGVRHKEDRTDAFVLADYALRQQPARWVPLEPQHQRLRTLVRRRQQLLELRQGELNRLEGDVDPLIKQSVKELAVAISGQIETVEKAIYLLIASDGRLAAAHKLLMSIPALGKLSAALLLGELPPIDAFASARQLSAYAGLIPREHTSGSSVRGRPRLCKQGRAGLRRLLHMPALVAKKHCPPLRQFAERLLANGKTKKAVVAAVARKLLALCFALLRSGQPFNPLYRSPLEKLAT